LLAEEDLLSMALLAAVPVVHAQHLLRSRPRQRRDRPDERAHAQAVAD
jgi:hypothetical protein